RHIPDDRSSERKERTWVVLISLPRTTRSCSTRALSTLIGFYQRCAEGRAIRSPLSNLWCGATLQRSRHQIALLLTPSDAPPLRHLDISGNTKSKGPTISKRNQ